MKKNWYSTLPWIALLSGVLIVVLIATAIVVKPTKNVKSVVNRKIAYEKLKEIKINDTQFFGCKQFIDNIEKMLNCPVINTKWLVDNSGTIIYAKGLMAPSTPLKTNVYKAIDNQSQGLLYAVDESLSPLQKEILYVAAAIRVEGEHNDMVGHIVVPLKTSSDELAGFIGVAYDLEGADQTTPMLAINVALFICFIVYWLSMPLWVYFDLRGKNEKHVIWALFVLIGNLPAYIAYLLLRKHY